MKKYLTILGMKVTDRVTGFSGIATSVSFDLYGCVQVVVTPAFKAGEKDSAAGKWLDHSRLQVTKGKPVMDVPTFENVPGGQELPMHGM